MPRSLALFAATVLAVPVASQRILHNQAAPPNHQFGQVLRSAADTNGDGVADFVVAVRDLTVSGNVFQVQVASGLDGSSIRTFSGLPPVSWIDAAGIGDADNDGRSDVAVMTDAQLRTYSGATGAILFTLPAPSGRNFISVAEAGDQDGDGRADIAVVTWDGNATDVRLLRGNTGALLGQLGQFISTSVQMSVRDVGDVTGDGKNDLALCMVDAVRVLRTAPIGVLRTFAVAPGGELDRTIATIDIDGDGKKEVLLTRSGVPVFGTGTTGVVEIYGGNDGLLRLQAAALTGPGGINSAACSVGDLDQDGMMDFAVRLTTAPYGELQAFSGRTGKPMWSLLGSQFLNLQPMLASVGDVDADGFGDFAAGNLRIYPASGWLIVSGKVLADVRPQAGACGGGPFLPRLGMTRPVLGQPLTIALQDGPFGSNGLLAFSLRPAYATYLGASSCFAFFDLGGAFVLHATPLPQWSVQVPLPLMPQLAGFEVAMQCVYTPTSGVLGYDLSNGLWARLGYQ